VLAAVALLLVRFALPVVWPEGVPVAVFGGLGGTLLVLVWWLFFSRAAWPERVGALALMALAVVAAPRILHPSIATGMMGMMFPLYAIPALAVAFVAWAVATRGLPDGARRLSMVVTILAACGAWALVRTGGITGDADSDFAWRWSPTPEEQLLARVAEPAHEGALPAEPTPEPPAPRLVEEPAPPGPTPAVEGAAAPPPGVVTPDEKAAVGGADTPLASPAAGEREGGEWPGFRGPGRDGVVRGARIEADWTSSPPVELWRRPVGPGWSSFAVQGGRLYTQEQRGEDEIVSCYDVTSGEPVWAHRDTARFWESNAGPGPRATPTLDGGRVYTFGATGIVNALDSGSGAVVWSRDAAADTLTEVPGWGFAGSPLVVGDTVVVAAAGVLVAYDAATGDRRWQGPPGGSGYSSPQLLTIEGQEQVVLLNGRGAIGVAPSDGTVLWEHEWPGDGIVQPALTGEGDVLIGTGSGLGAGHGMGVRRIAVRHGADGWTTEERWTSAGLKPYFNDFVVHEGYAFGFDGSILACIDLADGQRRWKGGRYGHGQIVLLPDQDLLLVLSEKGELALVRAVPDQFTEVARVPAIEGKTWNHPALVDDVLLVRNDREMAACRVSLEGRP